MNLSIVKSSLRTKRIKTQFPQVANPSADSLGPPCAVLCDNAPQTLSYILNYSQYIVPALHCYLGADPCRITHTQAHLTCGQAGINFEGGKVGGNYG